MKKFDYKWVIAALCFLIVFITLGFYSSPRSLYIVPVCDALGISRSAYSLSDTFRYIATSITNIFFGAIIGRYGSKKLILVGFASLTLSALVNAYAPNVYFFYLGGALAGFGFSFTTTAMVGVVINKWFSANRGTVMGVILASNGIGGAISSQIISSIIYNNYNTFSYRSAFLLVATIFFVCSIVVLIFFRDKPKQQVEQTAVSKKSRKVTWQGLPFNQIIKKPYFYATCVSIFLAGLVLQGTVGIATAHFKDIDLAPVFIATILSVHSLTLTGSKFFTGFLYDRTGLRTTANICLICAFLMMFSIFFAANSTVGKILAIIYAILSSLALPLETIMLPIYANDLFGEAAFDKVLGIFVSVNTAGYALGSIFANAFHDIFGNYNIAFVVCAIMVAITFAITQFVITASHKERKRIESEIKG